MTSLPWCRLICRCTPALTELYSLNSANVWHCIDKSHHNDVIIGAMASQIANPTIVYSTVYSGADKKSIKSPRLWPLCGEFTGDRWIPRIKGQWREKCLYLMTSSWVDKISGMCLKTGGRSCFALPPANSIIDYFLKNASGRFDRVLWIALWIHKRQCFKAYTPHFLKKIALNCHKTIRLICKSRSKYISMTVGVLLYKILMWSVKNLAWLVSPLQREYLFVIRHCFNIELFVAGFGRCVCPCVYVNIWLTVGPGTLEMLHHRVLFLLWQLIFCA